MYKFDNLNQALIGMSRALLSVGKARKTRGFDCIEAPFPVTICIENPTDRYINIPQRKWNKLLGWVESLWIASGTNHMELVGSYVKNMYAFSDDQQFMRAAYGPRIRAFSGFATDYAISDPLHRNVFSGYAKTVDQLQFVVESLQRDINTRQAVITIHDPVKDDFDTEDNLKVTKDTPCCRSVHFQVIDGKLDCILHIRSNDLIWGFSAVNVFNFTLMQEYISYMIGVPVGKYYHIADNLHFYADKLPLVKELAALEFSDYESEFGVYEYPCWVRDPKEVTLKEFDLDVNKLFLQEKALRTTGVQVGSHTSFLHPLFHDWSRVFYNKWNTVGEKYRFDNPYLNKLFHGK